MSTKNVSIIIPTLNEEEGIAKTICSIPPKVKKIAEVIVVDSSKDMTPIIAERLGAKVIRVPKKGKGYAMKVGVKHAKGDIIIFMDGDGTDPPKYIPKMLKKLKKYDLVLAARNSRPRSPDKGTKLFFLIYIPIARSIFGAVGFKTKGDPLAGYRALKKSTWYKLNLKSNDLLIETEMNLKALDHGLKIYEIAIPVLSRGGGILKSKSVQTLVPLATKIINYCLKYSKDKIVKEKLKSLKARILEIKKILMYK